MTTTSLTALYDDALLGILQKEGQIAPFLDVIFGFLQRRTDFFQPLSADSKLGFVAGAAKKLTVEAFDKQDLIAEAERKRLAEKPPAQVARPLQQPPSPSTSEPTMASPETGERRPIPRITAQHADNPGNGAVHDRFAWNQTNHDLDVRVYVPRSVTKSKQLLVELNRTGMKIALRDQSDSLVDGTFRYPIKSAESMWIFVPGEYVQITLEKEKEGWWDSLLVGEGCIDLTKIDAEISLFDLPNEEQQHVRRMVHDEKMKATGKLTSDQQKMAAVLKTAWDVEGSPFKGKPFDPAVMANIVHRSG